MKWAWAVIAAAASHVDKGLALLIASYPKERERERGQLGDKTSCKKTRMPSGSFQASTANQRR